MHQIKVELISIVGSDGFAVRSTDISLDTMMIELTGNSGKIDAFIKLINEDDSYEIKAGPYGVAGLGRSEEDMFDMEDFDLKNLSDKVAFERYQI